MKDGIFDGEPRRLVDVEKGLALLPPADVEVGHMDLVPRREFLEDVVVP